MYVVVSHIHFIAVPKLKHCTYCIRFLNADIADLQFHMITFRCIGCFFSLKEERKRLINIQYSLLVLSISSHLFIVVRFNHWIRFPFLARYCRRAFSYHLCEHSFNLLQKKLLHYTLQNGLIVSPAPRRPLQK